jgi:tetratricopeptide (TPR) repeat protein
MEYTRMTDSPDTTDLVQRGKAAARIGRLDDARDYLQRAVQQSPEHVEAWMALAAVEDDRAQKIACFQTVLELDPGNSEAQLALEMLQDDVAEAPPATEETSDELESVIAEASRRLDEAVGPPPDDEIPLDDESLFCANHPNTETVLRCNRCSKPICTRCAVQTPVGYRCKQCVGQQQSVFYTGGPIDYVIGGIIALVLGGIASFIAAALGMWFFSLILGAPIGIGIAEAVRLAVRRRRSQYLWLVVAGGILVSAIPALFLGLASIWTLVSLGLYLLLAVGAASARLR